MKKILLILLSFILLTFLLISNCTGVNGNPTELVGKWKAKWTETNGGFDTDYEITITFEDDGKFKAEYSEEQELFGGGDTETEIDYEGNYYGNPSNSPKTITLEVTKYDEEIDGVDSEDDKDKESYHGSYYIVYTTPYKLCLSTTHNNFNTTYTKQD